MEKYLLAVLYNVGFIKTHINEEVNGDIETVQLGNSALANDEKNVIAALKSLHVRDLVRRSEQVHAFDTNRYTVTWSLPTDS